MQFIIGKCFAHMQELIGFTDQLHDRILNAVMNHFYVMSGGTLAEMGYAGASVYFGRYGFQDGPHFFVGFHVSSRHNTGAGAGTAFSTRDANSHKMKSLFAYIVHPA